MEEPFAGPGDETEAISEPLLPIPGDRRVDEVDVGTSIDRYVLLRPLGSGGMGIVYLAFDPELDRRIALKLLRPDRRHDEDRSSSRLRLFREAQALARLSHPNVVHVYDVGTYRDRVYLAMEFIEGQTMDEWRAEASPSTREILDVLVRAGAGLLAAHRAGLIHLDFKPKNVVVGQDGEVRVLDFGLAREPGNSSESDERHVSAESGERIGSTTSHSLLSSHVTGSDVVMGTPGYVAPELYVKSHPADARADQFAFGVTAWQSLYGTFPFPGKSREELSRSVRKGKMNPPPRTRDVPSHIHQAVMRAMSPNPAKRFPSMAELLAELQRDPGRRNRRIAYASLAVVGLGAAGYAYDSARARQVAVCQGAEERLVGIWNAERANEIRGRFLASGVPYAAHAASAALAALHEHAEQWVAMRTDACEATRLRGEQSERLMDLRISCLDAKLEDIRALADVFAEADAAVVENAVRAAADLSPLEECSDADELLRLGDQPADAATRERKREVDALVSDARALGSAGRLAEAVETAEAAARLATTLRLPAESARAHYYLGQLRDERGDGQGAFDALTLALQDAERGQVDTLRGQIYGQLTYVVGRRLARYEQAHFFARTARSIFDRVGADARLRAKIDSEEAVVFTEEGELDKAITLYERVLDVLEREGQADSLDAAAVVNNLGSAHYMAHHPERALEYYTRARELWERSLGPDHPQVALVYGNIGNVHQQRGDYEAAIENLQREIRIDRAAKGTDNPDLAVALNNLAAAYQVAGEPEKAAETMRESVRIFEASGHAHPSHAAGLSNLAEMLNDLGRYEEAAGHAEKAVKELDELFPDDHPYKAFAACSLGEAVLGLGDVEGAIPHLENAHRLFIKTGVDPLGQGDTEFALARAFAQTETERGRVEALLDAARTSYEKAGKRAEPKHQALDRWAAKLRP